MSALLNAECVIGELFRVGFLEPQDWKQSNIKRRYKVSFWRNSDENRGIVSIEITVEHDVHKMSRHSLKTMRDLSPETVSAIADQCSIE